MAVTQQLARIPAAHLAACRQSVETLGGLCSFTSIPERDYCDLDWWPVVLKSAWQLTGADDRTLAAGFDGDEEVNPACRDVLYSIDGHPVAEAVCGITPDAVRAVVPPDPEQIEARLGSLAREALGDPAEHLAEQHTVPREFYVEAARRELAVARWWD
ncbi:hypothetical protein G3I59_18080 [Amycolatopsis rubida]|uniref:Uncharacterized protein n=1 Tax=Amycolatopsis rubida TaxID=112413 RepID=A0A1I5UUJ9_9PSEU|nr:MULTISPECIES: hypothetical protein [Amycolatopsis]MYW92466.1 hypothetical protein [Amycolatopsis rubida]NEC57454.1 hypothetical protein [Amycolatopsis rubida]OAP26955.1 hypothetical protein A4R44_02943 [Amycolatopsis sp. M39]SFP98717.1 hypothetical protein SAMN05421854_10892 [Amycolatopsis rubida]